ncbi:MAG: hypothetical protein WCA22_07325 [Candidatus Binatus sp.]
MNSTIGILLTYLLSVAACLVITPLVRRFARRFGALDMPDGRRIHVVPTPRWGGLAIYLVLLIVLVCAGLCPGLGWSTRVADPRIVAVAIGATVLLIVGLFDDAVSLRPAVKLGAEVVAACLVALSGWQIKAILGFDLGSLAPVATVIWIVAFVNGFNMVDGLDGLATGLATMMCATLIVLSLRAHDVASVLILVCLAGALTGFLRYNFNPASIFLGDSGSLFVGFLVSTFSVNYNAKGSAAITILVPTLALGLPLVELSLTIFRRLMRLIRVVKRAADRDEYAFEFGGKAALFTGDRDHIHHRLLALGLGQRNVALLMYAVCLLVNASAIAIISERHLSGALVLIAVCVLGILCVRTLGYEELQPLRKGLFLPLFPSRLLTRPRLQFAFEWCLAVLSLVAANLIHGFGVSSVSLELLKFSALTALAAAVQVGALAGGGLYQSSYALASAEDAFVAVRSLACAALTTWLIALSFGESLFPTLEVVILDLYALATLVLGCRVSFHLMKYAFLRGAEKSRRVLIFGTGSASVAAMRAIQGYETLQMTVIGFVDDAGSRRSLYGLPVLGTDALCRVPRTFDEVILPETNIADKLLKTLVARCKLAQVSLKRLSINCVQVDVSAYQGDTHRPAGGAKALRGAL